MPRCPQVEDLGSGRRRGPPSRRRGAPSRLLSAGALAVRAPWPAAGPTLAFLQLLLSPANAAFSGHLLLGILDPADELVAGQRRDVLPGMECRRVGDQRLAQVYRKLVHHPTGHLRAAHMATVASQGEPYHHPAGHDRNITELLTHSADLSPGMTRSQTDRLPKMAETAAMTPHPLTPRAAGAPMSAAPRVHSGRLLVRHEARGDAVTRWWEWERSCRHQFWGIDSLDFSAGMVNVISAYPPE